MSPSTIASVEATGSDLEGKAPFGYITAAMDWIGTAFPTSDCTGRVLIGFDGPGSLGHITVIDTDASGGVLGVFQSFRPLFSVLLYAGLCIGLAKWAWSKYAPGGAGNA